MIPPIVMAALLSAKIALGSDVEIEKIIVRPIVGEMECAGVQAIGCFQVIHVGDRAYGILSYDMSHDRRVRPIVAHEAIHAIRWLSGDTNWQRHDEAVARAERRARR